MIKSTHPEFEKLALGGAVKATPELVHFLDEISLPCVREGELIHLVPGLELLDPSLIRAVLEQSGIGQNIPTLEIHRVVGSTNDVVMQRLAAGEAAGIICAAEMQTAGKGRRGRHWVSPFGRNIYLSYGRFVNRSLASLGGLSIVVGMEVVEALRSMGLERVGLKWPNDVFLDGGKLGGILVELRPADARGIGIVVGIGLNLSLSDDDSATIEQSYSTISSQLTLSRNELLGRVCARLLVAMDQFNREGFDPFANRWRAYNLYADQQVRVLRGESAVTGIDRGVDEQGNLMLETATGIEVHNSGEVSVRPVTDR